MKYPIAFFKNVRCFPYTKYCITIVTFQYSYVFHHKLVVSELHHMSKSLFVLSVAICKSRAFFLFPPRCQYTFVLPPYFLSVYNCFLVHHNKTLYQYPNITMLTNPDWITNFLGRNLSTFRKGLITYYIKFSLSNYSLSFSPLLLTFLNFLFPVV